MFKHNVSDPENVVQILSEQFLNGI